EEAGFALGRLESRESSIQVDERSVNTSIVPAELFERLERDPDARIDQFIVVAYPLPIAGLSWFQERLRLTAERADATTREAADLRRIVRAMEPQIASLYRRAETLAQRENEPRAELLAANAELVRQSDEFHALTRALVRERNDFQTRLDRIRY